MQTETTNPELTPRQAQLLKLFQAWTPEEKQQALAGMSLAVRVELSESVLAAVWTPSDLRAAVWTPSDLRAAGWTPSDLRAAGWTPSDLRAADKIEPTAKSDIQKKAKLMGRVEAVFVADQLRRGLMKGDSYGTVGSCGCYLGCAAKAARQSVEEYCRSHGIVQDGGSPAEQWFMNVNVGDTPENSYAAKMGVEWIAQAIGEVAKA